MTDAAYSLPAAREAFARRDWVRARDGLIAAHAHGPLSADDVFMLGDAVWWLGAFREAQTYYEQAYDLYLDEGRGQQAAMTAVAIAGFLYMRGEAAAGSGWVARAMRLLENQPENVVHGYLQFMDLEAALGSGDADAALAAARAMQTAGHRFADPNLVALGVMGEGRTMIQQGQVAGGIALLDEAMLAAVSDELAPEWAGNIYCQMMRVCHELSDLRRAGEWTEATSRWCDSLPASGPFVGVCRVHRAQVLHARGAWQEAEREAARACEELGDFDLSTVAEAHYQIGEARRLRGEFSSADRAYRQAHHLGRDPQPGLALLQLAQGRASTAAAAIAAALLATGDRLTRFRLRAAQVEIALATGDVDVARLAAEEMVETAAVYRTSGLQATAGCARAAVLLATGAAAEALPAARAAGLLWQQANATYEVARTRLLVARAYMALGSPEAAALELDAAEAVFTRLGAALDARHVAALRGHDRPPGGLTEREVEVVALVAAGATNREIAGALVISEKTVARHLSNIFIKLGLTSRTAVAAYAYEHGLASRGHG